MKYLTEFNISLVAFLPQSCSLLMSSYLRIFSQKILLSENFQAKLPLVINKIFRYANKPFFPLYSNYQESQFCFC